MSTGDQINGSEVFVRALYGAASGIGMSASALMQLDQAEPAFSLANATNGTSRTRPGSCTLADRHGLLGRQVEQHQGGSEPRRPAAHGGHGSAGGAGDRRRRRADADRRLTFDNTHASVLGDAFARAVTSCSAPAAEREPNAEEALTILGFREQHAGLDQRTGKCKSPGRTRR